MPSASNFQPPTVMHEIIQPLHAARISTRKGFTREPAEGGAGMMTLALSPMDRLAEFAPLVVRVTVGVIMAAHGLQKLLAGPAWEARGPRGGRS